MGIEAQIAFLNRIKLSQPANQVFAGQIADILNIGLNEAYKKISGKSYLSLEQVSVLCKAFNTSFNINEDRNASQVTFNYNKLSSAENQIGVFLSTLEKELIALTRQSDVQIFTTTDDIPLFHFFKYPNLTAFKLYFWKSQISADAAASLPFDRQTIPQEMISKAYELYKLYSQIPSTEIWTHNTLLGTLSQLQYVYESDLIPDRELLMSICDEIKLTLKDVGLYATRQSKGEIDNARSEFNWYVCELSGCINYLIRSKDEYTVYHRFNTFNFLRTTDKEFCREIEVWTNNLIEKSINFTRQGQKLRNNYLNDALARCDAFRESLNKISYALR